MHGLHRRDGPIWLWFEHDLWDQAALIRVLSLLAERRDALHGRLLLVPGDGRRSFPDLADEELAALHPVPLSDAQLDAGAEAWDAFAAEEPAALDELARRGESPLPHLAAALRRHLMDLPWTTDGLALTERLVLQAVRDGAADDSAVFRALRAADPVFHVTDLIVGDVLRRLSEGARRLVTRAPPLALTTRGAAVLAGEVRHTPAVRFLGGVAVGPGSPWRWDPAKDRVVSMS